MAYNTRVQHKLDTAANWTSKNPILLSGELGIVKDGSAIRFKVGDGTSKYVALEFTDAAVVSHIANTNNPHGVTKEQVGLGNVDNTPDADKVVKSAASADKLSVVSKGSATKPVYFNANGVPVACTYSLNADVPSGAKFTDTVYTHPDTHAASMITGLATVATSGSYNDLSNKPTIPTSLPANGGNAATVGGFTVGTNVPPDAVFTDTIYTLPEATTSALGGVKVGTNISVSSGTVSVANASTSTKGVVKLSSATNSTSTSLAATASAVKAAYDLANGKQSPATTLSGYGITDAYTKAEVDNKVAGLVDSAPEALNTLNELAAALGNDANFSTTVSNLIGQKADASALAKVATSGSYNDLSNKPTIPSSLPANGGNAATVGGFTVGTNVPADAKFTDTVYTLPNATASTLGGVIVGTNISVSNGTISVANGSTSAKGVVQLTNSTSSTSTTTAATPAAVKSAYDLANGKQSPATTLSGYGITDAYTKTEVDTAVNGAKYTLPTASSTLGGVKTTSTVTSTSGLTACPIISGVPYYKNTTYSAATTSANGLMSSGDKTKLDGIAAGANAYTHPSTHAASMITGLATVATSGSYNDLSNKPTIPAVTKVTFTASDSKWGSLSNGRYPLTISASGGEFLNCYRTNGSNYDKMDVNVTVSGNNIIIYSLDKFAGYMTYLK